MADSIRIHKMVFNGRLDTKENIEDCLEFFSSRLNHLPPQLEFTSFYRYQFARYMSMKANALIGLIEGDMISDLILDAFEEAEEEMEQSFVPLSREKRINILTQLKITFPCHFDSIGDGRN